MVTQRSEWTEQDLVAYADPALYIGVDDRLQVMGVSNSAGMILPITGRILLKEGRVLPFEFTVTGSTAYNLFSGQHQLAQGFLLSLEVTADDGAEDNVWTYAKADLVRGSVNSPLSFMPVMAGYVGQNMAFGFPRHRQQRPTDGAGLCYTIAVPAPAAGADWTYTVPANSRQR